MSNIAVTNLSYTAVEIESLDGSKKVDLTNSILYTDYFEDILSHSIMVKIQVSTSNTIFNGLPIRGGERLLFHVETASGEFKRELYVHKVSNIVTDGSKEMFTLNLVSREALTNETTRVQKKYQKKPINEHVESILKDVLKTNNFKSENIERTSNSFQFIGTLKKPFYVLTWLGPKSVPSTTNSGNSGTEAKGVAGFLFYENSDGFNFRSIDSLVSSTKTQSGSSNKESIPKYNYSQVVQSDEENPFSIINYNFEKNIDLSQALRVGMYSNVTYFYDIYTNTIQGITYNLKNELKSKLGGDGQLTAPAEFGNRPSRILFRTSDIGVNDEAGDKSNSGRDNADMAKSFSRYNLLFTQSLNMIVPLNVNLKVGSIIYAQFQKVSSAGSGEIDEQQSGNYLIKELRHHFEGGQMVTSLRLLRDSYGLYGTNQ